MIRNVPDAKFKHVVATYEKCQPLLQSMTFEGVVSLFLEDIPIEFESVVRRVRCDRGVKLSYLYPMHVVDKHSIHWECLGPQMPISVDWPPTLHPVPLFNLHTNSTPTTTYGPLTEYVFIFTLSIRLLHAASTSTLMEPM